MPGSEHFDRNGKAIDLMTWSDLWSGQGYRFIQRTWIVKHSLEVVTVWDGFDPYRVDFTDAPPRIFKVAELRWDAGKLKDAREHAMPATEPEALAAHEAVVSVLRERVPRA